MKDLTSETINIQNRIEKYKVGFCLTTKKYKSGKAVYEITAVKVEDDEIFIEYDGDFNSESRVLEYYEYVELTYEQIQNKAEQLLTGTFDLNPYLEDEKESTELMSFNKETYVAYKNDLETKRKNLIAFKNFADITLSNRLQELKNIADIFETKIKKLKKIIWTIELYLGIKEDIVQIGHGEPASDDEIIYLLQERLYMDEEIGDPTDDGIDFKSIDMFEKWLMSFSEYHQQYFYELLVPFEKSVRIMRVRRDEKQYSKNPFVNSQMNQANFETYIIIRNGERIYTISTDLRFGEKLFPDSNEFMKMYDELKDYKYGKNLKQAEIENKMETYKRNMIIMQGLIDRTEVFGNMFGKINFLNGESAEKGDVEFLYESDDNKIGSEKESPIEWFYRAKEIKDGDRVLYLGTPSFTFNHDYRGTFFFRENYRKWYPDAPNVGLYDMRVDKVNKGYGDSAYVEDVPFIMYKPEKPWGSEEYKRRFAFRVDDSLVINFDIINHRNIEHLWHLMHDRQGRRKYLSIMKTLITVRNYKLKELEEELPFCKLLMGTLGIDLLTARDFVWWWKTKNKIKRSLKADDQKALRMIKRKHGSLN